MLLKYVEIAAATATSVFVLLTLLVTLRYRREILTAERRKVERKIRAAQGNLHPNTEIGMKGAEHDNELVGVK